MRLRFPAYAGYWHHHPKPGELDEIVQRIHLLGLLIGGMFGVKGSNVRVRVRVTKLTESVVRP